jgi:hypothetical protein
MRRNRPFGRRSNPLNKIVVTDSCLFVGLLDVLSDGFVDAESSGRVEDLAGEGGVQSE